MNAAGSAGDAGLFSGRRRTLRIGASPPEVPIRALAACAVLLAGLLAAAFAQAREGYATHEVAEGETWQTIAARYLPRASQWKALQRFNRIADPAALKPGMVLRIPARLMKPAALHAQVEFVRGQSTAVPPAAGGRRTAPPPAPLAAGTTLAEGSRIHVPDDGYLRLRLADGSVVQVLAGSDVALRRLRRRARATSFESVLDVQRGKVESEVTKQPPGRVFEIHAPGAVASVRGTRFDVSVDAQGRVGAAVTQGSVALQPRDGRRRPSGRAARVTAGQGLVAQGGRLGPQRALPPAPDLDGVPAVHQHPDRLAFDLGGSEAPGGYEVRVAYGDDFREVLRDGRFADRSIRFPALEDGDYTLGVRALDADGLAGPETRRRIRVHARPVPPLYQHPAPGARMTPDAAELVCAETEGAQWIHLQVSRRADFSAPEIDAPQLARCRLRLDGLPPGDYHWRVASVNAAAGGAQDHGPFAPPQRFSLVATPTIEGLDIADAAENPTLHWSAADGLRFRGQVARDAAFTEVVHEADLLQTPSWTIAGLPRGLYFVRLQAHDAMGLAGPFSPPRRLRVGAVVHSSSGSAVLDGGGEPVERP